MVAVAFPGPLAGKSLRVLAEETTWGAWRMVHPDTQVLSSATSYERDYSLDPYASYLFPRLPVLLVMVGRRTKIYPFHELRKLRGPLTDHVDDQELKIL